MPHVPEKPHVKRRLLAIPPQPTPVAYSSPPTAGAEVVDWHLAADAWKQFGGTVQARWKRITDEHLEAIGGNRDRLARSVRATYGLPMAQVEAQLRAFEQQHRPALTPPLAG